MSPFLRHCVECPKCLTRYLIAFTPYRNGSYLARNDFGSSEEYILYCSCGRPPVSSRWKWSEVRRYSVFSYPQWPRCKHPKTAARDFVKGSSKIQKLCAGSANIRARPDFHPRLYRFRNCEQGLILREVEHPHPIALQKPRTAGLAWRSVCQHC